MSQLNNELPHYHTYGRAAVEVHANPEKLGRAAARCVAARLRTLIHYRGKARVVFACAPSQDEFLANLRDPSKCGIAVDWSKVTAFHMDDYLGLSASSPQSFRHYLSTHLLQHVDIGTFHPIPAEDPDSASACQRYSALLSEHPIDIICMGIGENGHIAFNDPPVADFEDEKLVKLVTLDEACRQQQVNDGCFPSLEAVPTKAYTLTATVFRQARYLSVHVKGEAKAVAVKNALYGPISPSCPASLLRIHREANLYLDEVAARLL